MRVAAGAIARKYLRGVGIEIYGYLAQMGPIRLSVPEFCSPNDNPFFCADTDRLPELEDFMDELRKSGDSIGARINVIARGVPPGLGEPIFDRLEADLAHAMMSINAVKAVEIGDGFRVAEQRGTEHRDELTPTGFRKNSSGGVLGGISTGQDILLSIALKPTSSIRIPGDTIDRSGNPVEIVTKGRHDPCVGLRGTPIAEAMCAIVLLDHLLRHRAQNGDVRSEVPVITS
jgi:chorismate synthase